tara:strand:- start:35 stop:724 length:690 start_codon:yes stop_codon:yes gene_type:complete
MSALVKGITKTAKKAIGKAGRKRRTGRPTKEVKAIMDSKNVSKAEAEKILKAKNKKETKPTESKTSKAKTKADKMPKGKAGAEIRRLLKQQRADDMDSPRIGNRGKTYLNDPSDVGEGVNTMPLSKHSLPDKVSPRRRRQLVETGLAAATPRTKTNRTGLRNTGRFAEDSGNVAEAMGLRGKGIIDEDDAIEAGLTIMSRKGGGVITYKKRGGPIGVGAARTGFGKVRS